MKFVLRVIVKQNLSGYWHGMGDVAFSNVTVYDQKVSANCLPRVGESFCFIDSSMDLTPVSRVGHEVRGRCVTPVVVFEDSVDWPVENKPNAGWNEAAEQLDIHFISRGFTKVHSNDGKDLCTLPEFGFC